MQGCLAAWPAVVLAFPNAQGQSARSPAALPGGVASGALLGSDGNHLAFSYTATKRELQRRNERPGKQRKSCCFLKP